MVHNELINNACGVDNGVSEG